MSIDDYNATLISTDDNDNETENEEKETKPKITFVTKSFTGNVSWDSAWANRSGSGSGYKWKTKPSYGVTIHSPTSKSTLMTFRSEGSFTIEFYASDGAVCSKATKTVSIDFDNDYNYIAPSRPTQPTDPDNPEEPEAPVENNEADIEFQIPSHGQMVPRIDCFIGVDTYSGWASIIRSNASSIVRELKSLSSIETNIGLGEYYLYESSKTKHGDILRKLTSDTSRILSAFDDLRSGRDTSKTKLTYHAINHFTNPNECGWDPHTSLLKTDRLNILVMFTNDRAVDTLPKYDKGDTMSGSEDVARMYLAQNDTRLINMNIDGRNNLSRIIERSTLGGGSKTVRDTDDLGTAISTCIMNSIFTGMKLTLKVQEKISGVQITPSYFENVNCGSTISFKFKIDIDEFNEAVESNSEQQALWGGKDIIEVHVLVKMNNQATLASVPVKIKVK